MSEFKRGWEPAGDTPLVMAVIAELAARDKVPVARVTLYDIEDATRTFDIEERAVWELHRKLGEVLERLHRPR